MLEQRFGGAVLGEDSSGSFESFDDGEEQEQEQEQEFVL
jgi:hypothetical protein